MGIQLDLRKAYLSRQHGDLLVVYTWMNDERAMVLLPALRKGAPWYVVMDSAAWKYDEPRHMAAQCKIACDVLGIEPSQTNWVRIATIINEGLPDLIEMPSAPLPQHLGPVRGESIIKIDGKVMHQEEVKREDAGATYG